MTRPPDEHELIFAGEAGRDAVLAHGRRLVDRDPRAAIGQARELLAHDERDREALFLLAAGLRRLGFEDEARVSDQRAIEAASYEPLLTAAAIALRERRYAEAEVAIRSFREAAPDDPVALRLLAEVAAAAGARAAAEDLLRAALGITPAYRSARLKLASLLVEEGKFDDALAVLDVMLEEDPGDVSLLGGKAAALGKIGDHQAAARLYEQLVARAPGNAALWLSLGHLRNTLGDLDGSIAAYREAARLQPTAGVVWWSLANLKTFRFGEEEIAAMRSELSKEELLDDSRLNLHFALGKAYEDARDAEHAFDHYAAGNAIRHRQEAFDLNENHKLVARMTSLLTQEDAPRAGDHPVALGRPIFVVGLPRAGSTLVEQILASHSAIEGTAELHILPLLVREFEAERQGQAYPGLVRDLTAAQCQELGKRYLEAAQIYRKTDRPYFVDKLPNNWLHVELIRRILPQAIVIDARRHPLDCGWSLFKQNFARGQGFSYDLATIGAYYRDYVRFMAAVDHARPGLVHRVIHERLVADGEIEIRALLSHVGVPFEEGVLRFHENDRAVRTPSAAQVRKPLNREGMERWRPFEARLEPLKKALGEILDCYPEVPSALA